MSTFLCILLIAAGYLIGSIPWSLIIGKVFFKKDIRQYGSGNLGGTNAGRVLGKGVGLLVIVLDSMKAFLVMVIADLIEPSSLPYVGLAVCFGHCFPLFANFKGGKAVACSYGYLLGLGIFVTGDVIFTFLYPLFIFLIVLCLSKMVSLSSMCGLISAAVMGFLTYRDTKLAIMVLLLAAFVIYRHKTNILRILKKEESKVSYIK